MNLPWHNTDQVRVSSRLTYFNQSYRHLLRFSFTDFSLASYKMLTFCLDKIQICSSFFAFNLFLRELLYFCLNFIFQTFLHRLLTYWLENRYMNLSWRNTDQVWLLPRLTTFTMFTWVIFCPLLKWSSPNFSHLR